MTKYYPAMINIENKNCLVIGGGKVALRKIKSLLDYNVNITVISPKLCSELEDILSQNKINWLKKSYNTIDIKDSNFIFVATNDKSVNKMVYKDAKKKNILVNVVDNSDLCDFIIPSKVKRGDLTISISTNGKSPALAKKIREELEERFGDSYKTFVNLLGEVRELASERIKDIKTREALYKNLVYSDYIEQLNNDDKNQVKKRMIELLETYKKDY